MPVVRSSCASEAGYRELDGILCVTAACFALDAVRLARAERILVRVTDRPIIELQERIAFQEHELDRLNRVVADQQLELDALVKEVRELRATLRTGNAAEPTEDRTLEDDRPPHY